MFGFFAAAVGAYAVFRVARYRGYRFGGRWGHGGWGPGGRGGGWGRRWVLRGISERLDATPGQEKVIAEVMETLSGFGSAFREELEKARDEAARAVQGETFDPAGLREAWVRHDKLIADMRAAVIDAATRVHASLEPEQRKGFAELLRGGFRAFGGHPGHGYGPGHARCGGFRHGYAA